PSPWIPPLSLHDALPIYRAVQCDPARGVGDVLDGGGCVAQKSLIGTGDGAAESYPPQPVASSTLACCPGRSSSHCLTIHATSVGDRKSTRLNSSHQIISY